MKAHVTASQIVRTDVVDTVSLADLEVVAVVINGRVHGEELVDVEALGGALDKAETDLASRDSVPGLKRRATRFSRARWHTKMEHVLLTVQPSWSEPSMTLSGRVVVSWSVMGSLRRTRVGPANSGAMRRLLSSARLRAGACLRWLVAWPEEPAATEATNAVEAKRTEAFMIAVWVDQKKLPELGRFTKRKRKNRERRKRKTVLSWTWMK